jgi:hypothetical protein
MLDHSGQRVSDPYRAAGRTLPDTSAVTRQEQAACSQTDQHRTADGQRDGMSLQLRPDVEELVAAVVELGDEAADIVADLLDILLQVFRSLVI